VPDALQPRRRGRILLTLLALLFLVGVVPLLWTSFTLVSRSARSSSWTRRPSSSTRRAASPSRWLSSCAACRRRWATVARTLGVDTAARQFPARVAPHPRDERARALCGRRQLAQYLSVVDAGGSGARSGVQLPEPVIEGLLQEGFRRGLDGRPMISHPVLSRSLQEPVIVLGEPVTAGDEVVGVVLSVASLGPLWTMAEAMGEAGQVDVYVVDGRGRLIAHSNPARFETTTTMRRSRSSACSWTRAVAPVPPSPSR